MLWKLAWKNIWRNKLRSGVILSAIVIGLIASVFVVAFANGMVSKKIDDTISVEMTHLSVNTQMFIDEQELEDYFLDSSLVKQISKLENVRAVSPRVVVNASVATAHDMGGIQIIGINPEVEKTVSALHKYIPDSLGRYLNDSLRTPIVVGAKFAEKYQVRVGQKVIISLADTAGEQQSAAFRVCGIYDITNGAMEENKVFVLDRDLRTMTRLPENAVHEIAIQTTSNDDKVVLGTKEHITQFLQQGIVVRTWKEIDLFISIYTDFFGVLLYVIVGIILFALGFGIVNTILMSVVERQREFNMLISIGMRRKKVMKLVLLEGTILTCFGGFIGMIIGWLLVLINKSGVDMSDSMSSYSVVGIDTLIVPSISLQQFFIISLMVIITGILSAIYPAKTATKWKK